MRKRNTLLVLGSPLLLVAAFFFSACEENVFQPLVRSVSFEQAELNISGSTELTVICDIPSSLKEITLKLYYPTDIDVDDWFFHENEEYGRSPFVTDGVPRNANIITDSEGKYAGTKFTYSVKSLSTATTGSYILTVVAEPGGVTATCRVNVSPPPLLATALVFPITALHLPAHIHSPTLQSVTARKQP